MAIAHVSTGTPIIRETGSTHEIATIGSSGNILLMTAACKNDELLTNAESGWTKIIQAETADSTDRAVAAWWKLHTGSEAATYTVSHPTSIQFWGAIVAYSGVDATTPMDVAATKVDSVVNSASHTPASINIVTLNAWVVTAISKMGGSANGTEPSDTTLRAEEDSTSQYWAMADTNAGVSTGAYQLADWTALGNVADHTSITIALRPAVAAGANPKGPLGMPLHGPFGGPI